MKSNARPVFYFSAYPLKVLNQEIASQPSQSHSPYLKAILSGKSKALSSVRVLPMSDPYRLNAKPLRLAGRVAIEIKLPNDIELTQREWFNNYE